MKGVTLGDSKGDGIDLVDDSGKAWGNNKELT